MDLLVVIFLCILGALGLALLCVLAFCLPTWTQYSLSKNIINMKTGKPLSNNQVRLPLGGMTESLKDFNKAEKSKLKWISESAIGWWALNNYDVQLTNADWLKEMLSIPDMKFNRSLESFKTLYRLLGTSLLGCQGEAWGRMHKILYKAFIPANLHTFIPVFVRQTRLIADLLDSAAATGSTHEMVLAFNDLTLRVMVDAGFGNMIGPDDHKKVLTAIRHTLSATQNPLHDIPILCKLPFPANLELERQFRNLHEAADRVIAARSAAHSDGTYEASHDGKYMVDLLLEARETEGQLSDVELRDNIIMLLVAGSETTGTTLSWVIWHMCLYPDVYKKALQEVDSLDISWDHFNVSNFDDEMPYMTKVINETMRVKPAVSGIPERIYTEDSTLGDLYLPKGSRVGVSTIVMHHNPDYWPDAETFDPERFSEENTKARHRFSYLPFGLGRRMCMGKQFALNEMRVVLGLLLKYYTFEYDQSNGPVEIVWRPPTVTPKRALPMFIKRRAPAA